MIGIGIDKFVRYRRGFDKNSEPRKRIDAFKQVNPVIGNTAPGDTVKSVAPGDEIALDFMRLAALAVADRRMICIEIVYRDVFSLIDNLRAGGMERIVQVLRHLCLAIDHDGLTAGQFHKIDGMTFTVKTQFDPAMEQAFFMHPLAHLGLIQQVHGALFEHTGADGGFDLFAGTRFEHDGVDAAQMKKMGKKQARRPGADDANLGAHELSPECGD